MPPPHYPFAHSGPLIPGVRLRIDLGIPLFDFMRNLLDNCPMLPITIDEMKRNLLTYIERVEAGESIIIIRAGKPVAEIKPIISASRSPRPFALAAGNFIVPDDFDAPLPEAIIKEFEDR